MIIPSLENHYDQARMHVPYYASPYRPLGLAVFQPGVKKSHETSGQVRHLSCVQIQSILQSLL
jgi:hypothetical protein